MILPANSWTRRMFVGSAAAFGFSAVYLGLRRASAVGRDENAARKQRKMTIDLRCGSIGVSVDQLRAIELAHRHGFESVTPAGPFLATLPDDAMAALRSDLKAKRLVWGAAGLPVDFRGDETTFQQGLFELPAIALGLQRAGATRVGTWLRPGHDERTYRRNFDLHARRLRAISVVLAGHGLRFGLEYVGPKTSWTSARYPFIHTLAETLELISAIDVKGVGLVLDSWHWYTAGETVDDLLALENQQVVACDLNDAPAGVAVDEQMDLRRELPAATGVIDLAGFLSALVEIGYDGPVRAEPFNQALNQMDDEQAVAATAAAMRKAFAAVDSSPSGA